MLVGITLAVVQLSMQRFVHRFGEQSIAIVCLIGQSIGSLATFFAPILWFIYPIIVLRTVTSGFIFPTLGALTISRMSPREQGVLMGVTTALSSLMTMLGSLWAGAVFDRVMPGAPYWMGAGVFVLAALTLSHAPSWRCVPRST